MKTILNYQYLGCFLDIIYNFFLRLIDNECIIYILLLGRLSNKSYLPNPVRKSLNNVKCKRIIFLAKRHKKLFSLALKTFLRNRKKNIDFQGRLHMISLSHYSFTLRPFPNTFQRMKIETGMVCISFSLP